MLGLKVRWGLGIPACEPGLCTLIYLLKHFACIAGHSRAEDRRDTGAPKLGLSGVWVVFCFQAPNARAEREERERGILLHTEKRRLPRLRARVWAGRPPSAASPRSLSLSAGSRPKVKHKHNFRSPRGPTRSRNNSRGSLAFAAPCSCGHGRQVRAAACCQSGKSADCLRGRPRPGPRMKLRDDATPACRARARCRTQSCMARCSTSKRNGRRCTASR